MREKLPDIKKYNFYVIFFFENENVFQNFKYICYFKNCNRMIILNLLVLDESIMNKTKSFLFVNEITIKLLYK